MAVESAAPQAAEVERPPASRSRRLVGLVARAPLSAFLVVVGLLWLIPTIGLFVASFRTAAESSESGWWTALTKPAQLTLQSYRKLLDDPTMVQSLVNTALITVPACLLVVIIGALAAYAFAFIPFRGRDWVFLVVVGLLVVPLQIALIPVARLYDLLNLFGTIPGVVLFHVAFGLPFAIFLLRNFFIGIPAELLEAARMDGAGELLVFRRVVLPLGIPAIASLLIFQFLWVWNDLLVGIRADDRAARRVLRVPAVLRARVARRLAAVIGRAIEGAPLWAGTTTDCGPVGRATPASRPRVAACSWRPRDSSRRPP
jgi:alpha-glucoside transport system permease protein